MLSMNFRNGKASIDVLQDHEAHKVAFPQTPSSICQSPGTRSALDPCSVQLTVVSAGTTPQHLRKLLQRRLLRLYPAFSPERPEPLATLAEVLLQPRRSPAHALVRVARSFVLSLFAVEPKALPGCCRIPPACTTSRRGGHIQSHALQGSRLETAIRTSCMLLLLEIGGPKTPLRH